MLRQTRISMRDSSVVCGVVKRAPTLPRIVSGREIKDAMIALLPYSHLSGFTKALLGASVLSLVHTINRDLVICSKPMCCEKSLEIVL